MNPQLAIIKQIKRQLATVIVGQEAMIDGLLIGLLNDGHILLEGPPGLAKTLTISTLAQLLQLHFQRLQFTPDLLPADLLGTEIYNPKTGDFSTRKGPVFANKGTISFVGGYARKTSNDRRAIVASPSSFFGLSYSESN